MPPKDEDLPREIGEKPSEAKGDSGVVKLARSEQEQPADMKVKVQERAKLRDQGLTASSRGLPMIDMSFDDLAKIAGKSDTKATAPVELPGDIAKGKDATSDGVAPGRMPGDVDAVNLEDLDPGFWREDAKPRDVSRFSGDAGPVKLGSKMEGRDSSNDTAIERVQDNKAVAVERQSLEKLAEKRITDPEQRKEFLDNMKKFEERAAGREDEYTRQFEAQGMSHDKAVAAAAAKVQAEIVETYKNMERLLTPNSRAPISDQDRVHLAEQCMQHAADPYSISQGRHDTCTVAAIETRTFTNDPAAATKMIADIATSGQYTTNGKPPVTVKLDQESLKKQGESTEVPPATREDGHRDYASQIFEVTAANISMQLGNAREHPPGQKRYEQHKPDFDRNPPDSGERIMDYSKVNPRTGKPPAEVMKDGKPDGSLGINSAWQLAEISKQISPEQAGGEKGSVVAVKDSNLIQTSANLVGLDLALAGIGDGKPLDLSDPKAIEKARQALKEKEGIDPKERKKIEEQLNELEKFNGQPSIESAEQLKEQIAKAKAEGKLPIMVIVDSRNEPFWSDSGGGAAGGSGAMHVVTVTDYDPKTGVVKVQNQWGKASSHDVGVEQMYRAMRRRADNVSDLSDVEKKVAENRKNDKVDYPMEFELLRLQHEQGKVPDREYMQKLAQLAAENISRQQAKGGDPDESFRKANQMFVLMLRELPDQQKDVVTKLATALVKNAELARQLAKIRD